MMLRLALVLACASCASGTRGEPTPPPDRPADAATRQNPPPMDAAMTSNPVDMKFVGMEPGRPPLMRLRFDVTLRNPSAEPRWVIFPKETGRAPKSGGGVDGVEVDALGSPPVLVGRFQGTGSVQAVRLAGGAKVTLRRFTVSSWEDLPDGPASLEVVIASDLKVGGEDAAAWFGKDPTSPSTADVSEDGQSRAGSRHTPDRREVPITFTEEQRVKVDYNVTAAPVH